MLQDRLRLRAQHQARGGVPGVRGHANQIGADTTGVLPDGEPRSARRHDVELGRDSSLGSVSWNATAELLLQCGVLAPGRVARGVYQVNAAAATELSVAERDGPV